MLSGTSLDGIDVAVCEVFGRGGGVQVRSRRFATVPFAPALRDRIVAAFPPAPAGALAIGALHADVGEAFGDAVRGVAAEWRLDAVASHGLTIAHDDAHRRTLQIGDAFRIRERTECTVVYDFRAADTAAGGTGAPLVPFVDALLFADRAPCVALNLGGIANLTVLPDGIAFDSGPANLPIDGYVQVRTGGALAYDEDGKLARAGCASRPLLARLLADPYFTRTPPKSAGREEYGSPFVARWRGELDALAIEDAVATLTALTVESVARAVRAFAPRCRLLIVSGGGARNPALLDGLRRVFDGIDVQRSDAFGVDADAKEAIAFSVLGYAALRGRPAGMPHVTGARGARVLGAIAPHDLDALLARAREEEDQQTA